MYLLSTICDAALPCRLYLLLKELLMSAVNLLLVQLVLWLAIKFGLIAQGLNLPCLFFSVFNYFMNALTRNSYLWPHFFGCYQIVVFNYFVSNPLTAYAYILSKLSFVFKIQLKYQTRIFINKKFCKYANSCLIIALEKCLVFVCFWDKRS